jgi:methyl-accepting chemotaxis protein
VRLPFASQIRADEGFRMYPAIRRVMSLGRGVGVLRAAETWRAFFAALAAPAFALDRDGLVVAWNPACERLTGLSADQVMGTREHWRGFYRNPRPCLADVALKGGGEGLYAAQSRDSAQGALRAENWCDLPSSGRRYLTIDAVLVRGRGGEVVAVVETLQDSTTVKQQEEAMRRAQAEVELAIAREREIVSGSIGKAMESVAAGDLTRRLSDDMPEAYAKLVADFNAGIEAFASSMARVRQCADAIAEGAGQIAASSANLASRTERQATTLETSAAAVRDLSGVINEAATASSQTKDNIQAADLETSRSRGTVDLTLTSMTAIDQSSRRIGVAVEVIDEIAFQTNLLALNAGVEAARAGESGKGFAVVASEVRALAQRSAAAAREVKALISEAERVVAEGAQRMGLTASAFDRIQRQISHIDKGIFDVSARSIAQTATIKELNLAMLSMDQETQQNAAMAQQATGASQSLQRHCEQLVALVGAFRLAAQSAPRERRSA